MYRDGNGRAVVARVDARGYTSFLRSAPFSVWCFLRFLAEAEVSNYAVEAADCCLEPSAQGAEGAAAMCTQTSEAASD